MEITMEIWGDFACWTAPYGKVERLSYPFPTPSAVRGIYSSIYNKPCEFYWQITRIEVLNPIRYISFKTNEVKKKVKDQVIYADEERTQRQTVALRDVRYRFSAVICPRESFCGTVAQLNEQAMRRIRGGKVFQQPALGLRQFVGYFEESDRSRPPIREDMDAGLMVYDIFDLHDFEVRKKTQPRLSMYHAVMRQGVIEVPPYDNPEVLKGESLC